MLIGLMIMIFTEGCLSKSYDELAEYVNECPYRGHQAINVNRIIQDEYDKLQEYD